MRAIEHCTTEADLSDTEALKAIAVNHLFIDTLETRNSDSLDFHEVSVWGVRRALEAAYRAGMSAAPRSDH